MTPQAGEIWKYESQSDLMEMEETWLVIDRIPLNTNIDALCFNALCFETGEIDHIYYSEHTAYYWRRLA